MSGCPDCRVLRDQLRAVRDRVRRLERDRDALVEALVVATGRAERLRDALAGLADHVDAEARLSAYLPPMLGPALMRARDALDVARDAAIPPHQEGR